MACCFPFLSKRAQRRVGIQSGPSPCVLLILGTDGAGKTSLLMRLKGDSNTKTCTTWGFSTEKIIWQHQPVNPTLEDQETPSNKTNNVELRMYDVGGGQKIRGIWPNYFAECHGIVYVINTADTPERLQESASELEKLRKDERLQGKPMLILLNKYELRDACPLVKLCLTFPILPEYSTSADSKQQLLQATLPASKSKSNLSKSELNLNETSNLTKERKRVAKLPVLTTLYLHSSLLRLQASCCLISPTSLPSNYTPLAPSPVVQSKSSSPYRIAIDTAPSPTASSPSSPSSLSMKLQGAPTLSDGINWLISSIQLQWETSDMSQRIDFFKSQQEKKYEEEREKQRKRVEEWKREKEKKEASAQEPTPTLQGRSWSTSNMPAGVWGGIPPTDTTRHARRETSPLSEKDQPDTPVKPLDLPPPLPLLSPSSPTPASAKELNPVRTAKTLPPLNQRAKALPPLTSVGGLPPIAVGGSRGRTLA